tara:strand:+ start:132 stop:1313 length:1182 start_codon:yes stop_codon:yes gene_type:complete
VANKNPATTSNSKKTNKLPKPKAKKESINKVSTQTKSFKTKSTQEVAELENSNLQKIDDQLTKRFKNNIIISNIKWLIFAIIFVILIGLYYYQSEQIKNSDRSQFIEIERQLENFQTNLANTLVNDQNAKIEEINKNLNQVLKANTFLSEQNQDLANKINKIIVQPKIKATPDSTQKIDVAIFDEQKLPEDQKVKSENSKLILAIKKAESAVKILEKKLKSNKIKNNLLSDLNLVQSAFLQGKPFGEPLSNIATQLNIKISKEILKNAFNGVKPLEQLRNTFPKEARSALKEFHTKNDKDKISQKILVFLKTHITTRSLKPISGDSIDAILSRAERSLKLNNLGDALKELKSLSEDAKKSIHNWMIEAQITYKTKAELDKIFVKITEMRETND